MTSGLSNLGTSGTLLSSLGGTRSVGFARRREPEEESEFDANRLLVRETWGWKEEDVPQRTILQGRTILQEPKHTLIDLDRSERGIKPFVPNVFGIRGFVDVQRDQIMIAENRTFRRVPREVRRLRNRSAAVMIDLNELREEERDAEEPITDFAFDMAKAVLKVAYSEIDHEVPLPAIAPDSEGGIWIEWIRPGRNVRVVIPSHAAQRAYIYHRLNNYSDVHRLSGAKLAQLVETVILTA